MLPQGLKIVPYYDRTDLVDSALWTVGKVLIEGIALVVVVLFVFLGDVRSSLIVVATLVVTPLTTFILMNRYGLSANLMSLGGLAIAMKTPADQPEDTPAGYESLEIHPYELDGSEERVLVLARRSTVSRET